MVSTNDDKITNEKKNTYILEKKVLTSRSFDSELSLKQRKYFINLRHFLIVHLYLLSNLNVHAH